MAVNSFSGGETGVSSYHFPDMASIIFFLKAHPDYVCNKQKNWYGRAIQSIFLETVQKSYSHFTSSNLHCPNQLRAYTVSNLIRTPANFHGDADSDSFSFRITTIQKETSIALLYCVKEGKTLCVGSRLNLSGFHCVINGWQLNSVATYPSLECTGQKRGASAILFNFVSPVYFKDTQSAQYTAAISPGKLFGSLLTKWRNIAKQSEPEGLMDFISQHVQLEDQTFKRSIDIGNYKRDGSLGFVRFFCDCPEDSRWSFLGCLANFAIYAGVGKDTAIGFGQTQISCEE